MELLRKNGIPVSLDSLDVTSHMKVVVIDERFCFIGSHNMTHSALGDNHEFSLLVDSRELAAELAEYIGQIIEEGKSGQG